MLGDHTERPVIPPVLTIDRSQPIECSLLLSSSSEAIYSPLQLPESGHAHHSHSHERQRHSIDDPPVVEFPSPRPPSFILHPVTEPLPKEEVNGAA